MRAMSGYGDKRRLRVRWCVAVAMTPCSTTRFMALRVNARAHFQHDVSAEVRLRISLDNLSPASNCQDHFFFWRGPWQMSPVSIGSDGGVENDMCSVPDIAGGNMYGIMEDERMVRQQIKDASYAPGMVQHTASSLKR